MDDLLIILRKMDKDTYILGIPGLQDFIEDEGEAGKTRLIEGLESIANHLKHGPTLMPAFPVLQ